jgi:PleD family two-component response regulator
MSKILVVEDDPRGRYLICEVLRREGYQVEEACDGAEALEVVGYLSAVTGKTLLQDIAEVLPKPFEFDALRSAVQRLLVSSAPRA